MTDPLKNPNNTSPTMLALFEKFVAEAKGQESGDVVGAAMNVILNVIRQVQPTRDGAERSFDNIAGYAKNLLLEQHYYNSGERRNIFPFTQNLSLEEMFVNQSRLNGR